GRNVSHLQDAAIGHFIIHFNRARWPHAYPGGLDVQELQKSMVVLVHQNGCARSSLKFHSSADMVDVGVSYYDLRQLQMMLTHDVQDLIDLVARIDDHSFMGLLIADDRAIALQLANRKDLMKHSDMFLDRDFFSA